MALWTANTPPKYLNSTGTYYNVADCEGVPAAVAVENKESAGWVQVTTLPGSITGIAIVAGGSGYTNGSSVPMTINGGGAGAVATADVANGVVVAVTVESSGSGYTSPTATLTDGTGTGASFTVTTSGRIRKEVLVAGSFVTANGFVANV